MRKSRFLAFMLSMLPGGGFMYLGYMMRGLQYMILFAGAIVLTVFGNSSWFHSFGSGWVIVALGAFMVIIWIYQLFDTMHMLTRMRDGDGALPEDKGLFPFGGEVRQKLFASRLLQKVTAGVLIVMGALALTQSLLNTFRDYLDYRLVNRYLNDLAIPSLFALALIVLGFRLLIGSKKRSNGDDTNEKGGGF